MTHEKFIIIDGNALLHRAWHALPPLTTQKGEIVNAVYGFIQILFKAFKELEPTYCAVTFDRKGPTFRHEQYAQYKATRVKQPDELYVQIDRIKEILTCLGIPIFEKDGFEADDVIATLCSTITQSHPDIEKIIVTGDMDTLQLVDEYTRVFAPRKGITDTVLFDVPAIREKYDGLEPKDLTFYKALRGDPSDNIPGIKGIGEKGAIQIVKAFKTYGHLLEWIEQGAHEEEASLLKEKVLTLLREQKDAFATAHDLVSLRRDVPFDFDISSARLGHADSAALVSLLQDLEFKSLLPRLKELSGIGFENLDRVQENLSKGSSHEYRLLNTEKAVADFLSDVARQKIFALDTETTSIDALNADLLGVSISFEEGRGAYIPWPSCSEKNKQRIKELCEDPTIEKTGHNIKYDLHVLRNVGIALEGIAFDSMVGAYVLNPGARSYGLDTLSFNEFGYQKISIESLIGTGKKQLSMADVPIENVAPYACEDADYAWRLYEYFSRRLKEHGLLDLCQRLEIPLIPVLARMERRGVKIDTSFLSVLSDTLHTELHALEKNIYKHAGGEFNINSPIQLKKILFEDLALSGPKLKKGKTGISTAASELEKMRGLHPIIDCILEYRERTKLANTYVDVLPTLVDVKTGRVHTSFNQTIAATGRLSSSAPNFQNIPIREALGREIRKSIVAENGNVLLAADYSQLELRIVASLAKDKAMLDVFGHGGDIHTQTAAAVQGVALQDVTSDMRRAAKEVNFGIIYGMGAHGLSMSTGMRVDEARDFIDRYFAVYPGIAEYMERTLATARKTGYVETLFGRRRYVPELSSNVFQVRAAAERAAINMPIQGTGADIIKLAMIEIEKHFMGWIPTSAGMTKGGMILQVHDELVFEIPEGTEREFGLLIKEKMESVVALAAPLVIDVKIGYNWGTLRITN
ncbi:DNA polymerase I [Candidatus Uhrbacteria bacterium]|nr:DNA polymerase I [Candidatus Uhrbacteria bacterium]